MPTIAEQFAITRLHVKTVTDSLKCDLKGDQAKAQQSLDKIGEVTGALEGHAHADLIGAALAGSGESIYRMVKAFEKGRNQEGGAEILRMVGSIAKLSFVLNKVTALAGPLGIVASELLSLGALFLAASGDEQASIKEQLKDELNEFGTKNHVDDLEGVMDQLEEIRGDLVKRAANSMSWDAVSQAGRFTGQQAVELGAALSWMRREETPEFWSTLFRTYLDVSNQRLQNVLLGLNAVKKVDGDKPTEDLRIALSVLEVILRQAQEALQICGPMIPKHETRWFIGDNSSMYFTDYNNPGGKWEGTVGSRATRIAVGSDGERIWHVGNNRTLYTKKKDGSWIELGGEQVDDIVVVEAAESSADHVLTVKDGELTYRKWDEESPADGWGKFVAHAERPYLVPAHPAKIAALAATRDGAVYLLMKDVGRLHLWNKQSAGPLEHQPSVQPHAGAFQFPNLVAVASGRDRVYVSSTRQLWSKRHEDVEQAAVPAWDEIPWPVVEGSPVGSSTTTYTSLSATIDGVVAIIDMRMYRWSEILRTWSLYDGNTTKQLVVVPVRGWESFDALKATVEDLQKTIKDLEPPAGAAR